MTFYPFRGTPEGLQGIIRLFYQLKNPLSRARKARKRNVAAKNVIYDLKIHS